MKFINTGPEPFFEDVVNHMAAICGVPIAAIALEEGGRHWLNQPGKERGRECSECPLDALGWIGRGASVSNDFTPPQSMIDNCKRVARAYVATPLFIDGRNVGSLFIADTAPRVWTQFHIDYMTRSARLVAGHFEARALLAERERRIELEGQLRVALEAAEQASVAKSAFLANMSHEIRTPLNGVLGVAQALRLDELTPSQTEKVDLMIASGMALMTVLNDILDLSKVEAGKIEISPIDLEIRKSLVQTVELHRSTAEDKGVSLDLVLDDSVPERLRLDPVRTRQCLTNLMSNAVKFTSHGKVTIAASLIDGADGKLLKLSVRDTGIGMTPQQLGRLFTDFSQADETTTRRFGGTGLGLSISRKLARLMGGDIVADSEPGEGSTFTLTVLAEQASSETREQGVSNEAQPASAIRGLRILVADDNPINRRVVQMLLKLAGVTLVEAENGAQALERLAAESFDLVLMDVHMPVMDGNTAVARIRASGQPWSDIPVIALTADAMQGDREKLLASGMDAYVAKPIDQRDLFATLGAVLHRNPARRAA